MSSFTDKLHLIYYPKKNTWKTARAFTYFVGEEYSEDRIVVPKGFETDLASVPWPASMLIPKSGKYNPAAVLHDYICSTQERPRAECDRIFLEAMEVVGVPLVKRRIMYRAVRMFGWISWRNHSYKNEKRNNDKKNK